MTKKAKTPEQIEAKKARAKARRAAKKLPVLCKVEGKEVRKGDHIGFKADIEQYGKAEAVRGSWLILKCWDSEAGEYHIEHALISRCWIA